MTGWPVALAILIIGAGAAFMLRYEPTSPTTGYVWDRWQARYCIASQGKIACTQGDASKLLGTNLPRDLNLQP